MDYIPFYGAIVLLAIILAIQIGLWFEMQEQSRQREDHHRELLYALFRISKSRINALNAHDAAGARALPGALRGEEALIPGDAESPVLPPAKSDSNSEGDDNP